ncbi:hypothetical protein CROQUDRAFT_726211 [Cronartium quercuum f. sp. fusiforme G11]|uniref:Uncharacterized protein n=1 Tax=Cronartium quercuum f. sp. fusiforme G11 TaxID=708437 RepID=A0A9P6N9V4_9BASI|nr:hypothetical protein CROQUDRAFT_726211 [Cronartium quercuum f. sp. fusiforme G11]
MFSTNVYLSLVLAFFVAQSQSIGVDTSFSKVNPNTFGGVTPHVSFNETFYLTKSYDFDYNATLYDKDGKAAYYVSPDAGINAIILSEAEHPDQVTIVRLLDCTKGRYPTYFFNSSRQQWIIEDDTHQPGPNDKVFISTSDVDPAGTIQSEFGNYTIAEFSVKDHVSQKGHRPEGAYYSAFIRENKGHQPWLKDTQTLTLLFILLNHGGHCAFSKA